MKKNYFLKEKTLSCFFVILGFLFFNVMNSQNIYTSSSALRDAVNAAGATGGVFILKNGNYSGLKVSIEVVATAEKPIVIKAETIGGVKLTGSSAFTFKKSAYVTLEGFDFDCTGNSTMVKFEGSNNIRITRNVFKLTTTSSVKWVYIGGVYDDITIPYQYLSHHNRIDHNIFKDKSASGHYITVDGTNSVVQSQYDQIDHNYFMNNGPRAINEQESVRVGWSEMSKSSGFTTVEYNLFENCDGDPEIVSIKSCDNIVRHNTFKGSYGTLSFRHGDRNRAEGNYFFGNGRAIGISPDGATLYTGGMRIYGSDHVIINNYFEGLNGTKWDAPITLTQGDAKEGNTSLSKHFIPKNILIAYNTLVDNDQGIEIGFSNNGSYSTKMENITIANNLITSNRNELVKILDGKDQGNAITWSNNLMYPTGTATLISGATTTTLTNAGQVVIENPNLEFDNSTNTWKSSAQTPLYGNTLSSTINEDIEGQSRPSLSNPGADNYNRLESVRYLPMTPQTVGPNAYENVPLSLSPITEFALEGGTKTTVVATTLSWTAVVNQSWLSIDNTSGTANGSIIITAEPNTSGMERTGLLTVTTDTSPPVTIAITQVGPKLTLTPVANFIANGQSLSTTVSANVAWTATVSDASWLTIDTTSGTNDGVISITAAKNSLTTTRTGTLTVTGAGINIPQVITFTQQGALPTSLYTLINDKSASDKVVVYSVFNEEITSTKNNIASNTLDKNKDTNWSGNNAGAVNAGTNVGEIIYDLGGSYDIDLVNYMATKGKTYSFQILVSSTTTNDAAFTNPFGADNLSVSTVGTEFKSFTLPSKAIGTKYIKIVGYAQATSTWNSIVEIEFYGDVNLSTKKYNANAIAIYPIPAKHTLNIDLGTVDFTTVLVYNLDGKLIKSVDRNVAQSTALDVSSFVNGMYILKILNKNEVVGSKQFLVSH